MRNQTVLKLFFIINPVSGGKEKHDWEVAIKEYFRGQPHTIEFYLLKGKNDASSIQYYIDTFKPDRVIAVGGDGTVKLIAELIKETQLALGIIPAGSANGMARELNIPLKIEEALKVIIEGVSRKIDAIKINEEELCLHISDIGLNAMLVKYFQHSKKRRMWGYGKAIFRAIWEKQKMYVTLKTDDGTFKRKAYMVALANARKYGTGANINPDGDIKDGKFEVVVVRKLNVMEILKAIFTDRSFHPQRIEVFQTRNLEMTTKRKAYFQVDGEYLGKISTIKARILPQIVNVMLPEEEI